MLSKLFKYEWKAFYKMPVIVNLCILIITILGIFSMFSPFWSSDSLVLMPFRLIYIMFYIMLLIAGPITVCVLIAVRFYKNVYTDEAYLTHTLPVTPRQILLSKLFVSLLWVIITGVIVVFSIISLVSSAFIAADITSGEISYFMNEFGLVFSDLLGISTIQYILYLSVTAVVGCFFSILMLYSSISLGQMFTGHRILGAIIWYIAEYTIMQFVTSIFTNLPLFYATAKNSYDPYAFGRTLNVTYLVSLAITVAASIGLYFLTEWLMKKKLNLD